MKPINEAFTPEVQKAIAGIYVTSDGDKFTPIMLVEDLTADNFGIIDVDLQCLLTADDFRWYDEDGSDRDFRFGDDYYSSHDMPKELSMFLNAYICVKFAAEKLQMIKNALDDTDAAEVKLDLVDSISAFEKATDAREKLKIARSALKTILDTINEEDESIPQRIDDETCDIISDAIDVINEVLLEI